MNERLVLMDDEKEKLVDEILDLRQRVKVLQAELEALKKKVPVESEKSEFS
jgi:regulator of replication initiation timing